MMILMILFEYPLLTRKPTAMLQFKGIIVLFLYDDVFHTVT